MKLEISLKRRGLRLKETLELQAGRGMVVLGAGREDNTTLLRAIAGFEPARLRIDDHGAPRPPKRHFALCAAEPQLVSHMSVERNLRLFAAEHPDNAWNNLLRLLGLEPLLESRPHQLNPLQAHSVVLARAVLNQPKLLLIDEPNLEGRDRERYIDRLVTLLPGLPFPVISATGRVGDAARLGGQWLYLTGGEARAQGEATELLLREDLPLLDDAGAAFRLPVVVASHDSRQRRSHLDFRGGRLRVPLCRCKVGRKTTAAIPLAGAGFSTSPPLPESGLSGITVSVTALHPRSSGKVLVELEADGTRLWLQLDERTVDHKRIEPGKQGFAIYPTASIAAD